MENNEKVMEKVMEFRNFKRVRTLFMLLLIILYYMVLQDDTLKAQMQSFLLSTASQNEIATYDNKVGVIHS
jgi:hypothetical protein